jgi:hypothetical protein
LTSTPSGGGAVAQYWFDVETAQLLRRAEIIDGEIAAETDYTLDWSQLPPPDVPEGQASVPCVESIQSVLAEP